MKRSPAVVATFPTIAFIVLTLPICVAVGIAATVPLSSPGLATTLWVGVLFLVGMIFLLQPGLRRTPNPLQVAALIIAWLGVGVPMLLQRRGQTILAGVDYADSFPAAITTSAVALGAFAIALAFVKQAPYVQQSFHPSRAVMTGGPVLLLSAAALVALRLSVSGFNRLADPGLASAGDSYTTGYLAYAPHYLASMALYILHRELRRPIRRVAGACFLLALVVLLLGATRYSLLMYAVAWAVLALWRRRRSVRITAFEALAGMTCVIIALGLLGNLRAGSGSASLGVLDRAIQATEVFLPLAATVDYTSENGFLGGSSIAYLVAQPIPRVLWPSKPDPPLREFLGQVTDPREGRGFPIYGELYANFGYTGVVVGMGLLGLLSARLFRRWLRVRNSNPSADVIAVLLLLLLGTALVRGYVVAAVHTSVAACGPILLMRWVEQHWRAPGLPRPNQGWIGSSRAGYQGAHDAGATGKSVVPDDVKGSSSDIR